MLRKNSMTIARVLLVVMIIGAGAGCAYKGPQTATDKAASDLGTTLTNTYWKLITADGDQITTPDGAREIHVILRPDYRVTGFGGCNAFNGSWTWEEDQLVVGPLMSTKMACPELDTERTLMAALNGPVFTEISGDMLILLGSDGSELTFKAMYFQ